VFLIFVSKIKLEEEKERVTEREKENKAFSIFQMDNKAFIVHCIVFGSSDLFYFF
jgi:hypothetical protein